MSEFAGELFEAKWWRTHWQAPAIVALVPAIGAAGTLIPWAAGPSARWALLVSWLAILALLTTFAAAIGHAVAGHVGAIFVDDRNRVSTSRLQLFLWTVVVLSGYLAAVLDNAALHQAAPLSVAVPRALWAAMGVSTASFVASPFVLHQRQQHGGKMAKNEKPGEASWADLVMGEEEATKASLDIAKLQMVLVTVVLVLAYGIVLGYAFYLRTLPIGSLPKVNDAFAILLAVSHGGYLVRKVAPKLGDKKTG
jgi:hypothetical protein